MINWIVPFEVVTPAYLPFEAEEEYAEFTGFDRVRLVFENAEDSLGIWVTSEIGWNNVTDWDEELTFEDGRKAYYTESDGTQMLSWRNGKEVEYAIDYVGKEPLSKDELIQVASSIK
ncbi:DUF4367 domain-containing protein [Pseudalkalibacillus sp. Hm43]|uniref:DUF4367 domain-containing protein n=1 Tax=Pseudalkalibacillus sp. Hm43 TaxID=3450742 RepID=UPI003F430CA2